MLLACALVIFCTFDDYGMSWDEPYSMLYGRQVLRFLLSFGADTSAIESPVRFRGGAFHALVEGCALLAPGHGLLVRRLVTPLIGLLGLYGGFRLARMLGGARCGLLAVLLLALTPVYYGHMFINPADLPFAVGYVWSLYFIACCVRELPKPRLSLIATTGLVVGFTIEIRIGGILLLFYLAALAAGWGVELRRAPALQKDARSWRAAASSLGMLVMIAYCAMLALWPAALEQPLAIPLAAISETASFPKHQPVLFAGHYVWSDGLPWSYHLVYLLVQLPEVVVVCSLIGAAVASHRARKAFARHARAAWVGAAVLLLGSFVPLLYTAVFHPVAYDGMRHVLFVVPPLACLAAYGVDWLLERARHRPLMRLAIAGVVTLCCGRSAWSMVGLHPYEYAYYNDVAGGPGSASARFELDYWVTSFREAIADLHEYIERERASHPGSKRVYKLAVCGHGAVASAYLPSSIVLTRHVRQADFVLATTKLGCQDAFPGVVVAEVQRLGAPFAVVKRLRRPAPPELQHYAAVSTR
jgi:4-amino-4-deoxy-L-arabinose transferase-like glycosyltransferase